MPVGAGAAAAVGLVGFGTIAAAEGCAGEFASAVPGLEVVAAAAVDAAHEPERPVREVDGEAGLAVRGRRSRSNTEVAGM